MTAKEFVARLVARGSVTQYPTPFANTCTVCGDTLGEVCYALSVDGVQAGHATCGKAECVAALTDVPFDEVSRELRGEIAADMSAVTGAPQTKRKRKGGA